MPKTYQFIASSILGSAATSITLSNIPSTYTDLVLVGSTRSTQAVTNGLLFLELNGNAGANYSFRFLEYDGSTISGSANFNGQTETRPGKTAGSGATNIWGSFEIYLGDYASSYNKQMFGHTWSGIVSTATTQILSSMYWAQGTAITSIKLSPAGGSNFAANSALYLYGIKSA